MRSTVSSQSWVTGQRDEEEQRIRAISFQAEEGKEWVDHTEEGKKTDEKREEALKVRTFPPETEILPEVVSEKPLPQRKEWRSSPVVSQQEDDEDEEEEVERREEEDSQIEEFVRGNTMKSEQTRAEGNEKFGAENPPISVDSSSANASREGSGNITVGTGNYSLSTTRSPGSAGSVSTAVTLCPDANKTSCSNSSAAVSRSKDRDSSDPSRSGSGLDSSVEENPLSSELDTLAGSDNKSVNSTSEGAPKPAGSVDSEEPHVDEETLHSLQIRGFEPDLHPDRSRDLIRGLFDDSGSDPGHGGGEILPLGHFTEGAETNGEEVAGPHSVSSELMHQDGLGRSSVVTVTESRYDSESRHQFDREWAEGWGLQSLGFMSVMDDFY